jgi:AcrR family transcriptional regulator
MTSAERSRRRLGRSGGATAPGSGATAPGNGKRERNKAQNRTDILAAAREVFTELGYEGATVRDVIRRTRLASGTFYNYFPDKESVFRALLAESEHRRLSWLARVERGDGDYEAYLRAGFHAYFEFVVTDRTTFDLLRRNAAAIRALSKEPILGEQARLRGILERDVTRGRIPPVDAGFLAHAMVGVAFEVALLMVERAPRGTGNVEAATTFATDLFMGLLERAGRGCGPRLAGSNP